MTLRKLVNLALVVLMASSVLGLWISFAPRTAMFRFVLILFSVLSFRAVAGGKRRWRRIAVQALAYQGLGVSAVVAATTLVKVGQAAELWPAQKWLVVVETNLPAGLIVLGMPFMVVGWRSAIMGRQGGRRDFWAAATIGAGVAVAVSGSMASILILGTGVGFVLLWFLIGRLGQSYRVSRSSVLAAGFLGASVGAALGLVLVPGLTDWILAFIDQTGRPEIAAQSLRLIGDFPFTGGGLGSVAGLYAYYIRGLPVPFIPNSQNLFLNIGVELGLPGMLATTVIYAGALWASVKGLVSSAYSQETDRMILVASFTGTLLTLGLGLIDDPVFATLGLPLLLLIPALSLSFTAGSVRYQGRPYLITPVPVWVVALVLLPLILIAAINSDWLVSRWFSDLGSIEMARVELQGWPTGKWSDGSLAPQLNGPRGWFEQSLRSDPNNRTALHRLGLIAMERHDYAKAVERLLQAYVLDPRHRGIRKALGYSLAWTGDYQSASEVLATIPEAQGELGIYVGWWSTRGRADLSERSQETLARLNNQ